jgi:hypothetical protein
MAKLGVSLKDFNHEVVKEVLTKSLEQNEKQLIVYLIQREVEGESEQNTAQIKGIKAYIDKMNKVLINKYQ